MSVQTFEPIRKSVVVNVPPERAWEAFTAEIGSWWPLQSHSVLTENGRQAERLVLEGRVGGEIYEQVGEERVAWATVLTWDPPHRLSVRWRVSPQALTECSATFTPEDGGTRVDLVHSGWEAFGERADEMRSNYGGDGGWATVLGCFERFLSG